MMKLFIIITISILFIGCFENQEVTQEECKKLGKIYKKENVLNYRTGNYEDRAWCI